MPKAQPGFWRSVRDGIAGVPQDYTRLPIGRAITLLAVPMVLEMMMESLFNIVDVFWVARLGSDPVGSVALTESLLTPVFIVAMGLSLATTAFVARRIGENDAEGAANGAVQAIIIGLLVSLLSGAAGVVWASDLLRIMGATPAIVAAGRRFTSILLGGSASIVMLFLINAIFRGAGDAVIAMRVLCFANLINLALDPCLIFGLGPFPRLGVAGAAVATTIGRGCGVLYQLALLSGGTSRIVVRSRHVRLDWRVIARLLRISGNGMLQLLISMGSWMALVRMIAMFGGAALTAYVISIRIVIFFILPSWGMSNAAATLVGQNLGAGEPDRAEKSVWITSFYNAAFLGAIGVLFLVFAGPLTGFFSHDPDVAPLCVVSLRILAAGNICYAVGMVTIQAFNGAGDTFTPTVLHFFAYWVVQLPLAWIVGAHGAWGPKGVILAVPVAETVLAVASVAVFRRGKWKLVKI